MVRWLGVLTLFCSCLAFAGESELQDPTAPKNQTKVVTTKKSVGLPNLQSIVISQNKRAALINNRQYRVGQYVSGYKVIKIDSNQVWLEKDGKTVRLSVFGTAYWKR
ncbi:MSHA biogenesis protein MshK [Motilimonas pumila]|uniref:MSHA biogenesis protein MshK n=1 Tax=Motilimonas pumila TaxID=2303987 RepID=A0A418YHX7_9GAMM|nr:MSHA biogenesis protein MshK [Motilimonas pumila]RJG49972.1 MSHA biogenesis protein MshK [Motilimonas pumila]